MALRTPSFIARGVRIVPQCPWRDPWLGRTLKPGGKTLRRLAGSGRAAGFSLVEVVISLGIVAFAMLSTVGLLPLGLDTVRESMSQTVSASIVQEIRGELQQISFASSDSFDIGDLFIGQYAQYYGIDGIKTTADKAYYKATFTEAASTTAAGATFISGSATDPCNAKNVIVTLNYPLNAPENGRKSMVFSLLIARQNSN